MFDKCLNASAKVECDYATESPFLNRIFNRTLESPENLSNYGTKIFFQKKSAIGLIGSIALINRISLVISSIYLRLFLSIRRMVVPDFVCRYTCQTISSYP